MTYKSIDSITNQSEIVNFPTEFFNSLDVSELWSHILNLKIGLPTTLKHQLIKIMQ